MIPLCGQTTEFWMLKQVVYMFTTVLYGVNLLYILITWLIQSTWSVIQQIILRINGFSDFIHHADSKELEDKNTTFQKLDLFPSLGEGRYLLCSVPQKDLTSIPSPEDGNRSSFRNVVFLSSNSLESGRWTKSENPLILCVIHHCQNRIESTSR
jgi:hypothetical protein